MPQFIEHPLIRGGAIEEREYQSMLTASALEKGNTLVVAPTALGKTVVAIVLAAHMLEKKAGKILFLAPTKPLAEQHRKSFEKKTTLGTEDIALLTGSIPPKKRVELFRDAKVVCATPQTIKNDLARGRISLKEVALCIFDEAHRAVGNYSYVYIAEKYVNEAPNGLILALTASPGSSEEKIRIVCENLFIKNIEVKTHQDKDVQPYVQEIKTEWVKVQLPADFLRIKHALEEFEKEQMASLKRMGLIPTANLGYLTKKKQLELQEKIRKRIQLYGKRQPSLYAAASKLAALMKASHALLLLETQGISALNEYLDRTVEAGKSDDASRALKMFLKNADVREAVLLAKKLQEQGIEHPKLLELMKILEEQFSSNPDSRAIVFNHYRSSIKKLVDFLAQNPHIKPKRFIGQATKGKDIGMSQKEQVNAIQELKEGRYNCFVASSVHPDEYIVLQNPKKNIEIKTISEFVDLQISICSSKSASKRITGWKALSSDGRTVAFHKITHVHKHKRVNNVQRVQLTSGFDTLVTENHSLMSFGKQRKQIPQRAVGNTFIEMGYCVPNPTTIKEIDLVEKIVANTPKEELEKMFCSFIGINQAKIRMLKTERKIMKACKDRKNKKELAALAGLDESTVIDCTKRLLNKKLIICTKKGREIIVQTTEKGKEYESFLNWFFRNHYYWKRKYRCSLPAALVAPKGSENFCDLNVEIWYGKTKIPRFIKITEALGEFLGFYVAEGSARKTKSTSDVHLAACKKEMQDSMERSVKEGLGLGTKRTLRGIDIHSQIAYHLVKYALKCGVGAFNKEVPSLIFSSSTNVKWKFLEAYFRGDGHLARKKIQLTTVSRKLVTGLVFLLRQLGIKKIRVSKNPERTPYQIEIFESLPFAKIDENKGKRAYYNTVPTALTSEKAFEKFKNKYKERDSSGLRARKFLPNFYKDVCFDYIRKIETLDNQPKFVYDLSINPAQTFLGGTGLITLHNSVAEEGLDIPAVDLVVFYEPVPSEIRTIQRRGRTGRLSKGKVIVLMTEKTRDEAFYWVSFRKEKRMHRTLGKLKMEKAMEKQTTLQGWGA